MFRQLSRVHSISIRVFASGNSCSARITMAKLERSRWYDLACDMDWNFTYFIDRGVSRGPEHAFSNLKTEDIWRNDTCSYIFSGTNTHLYLKR
jgi:hypothetical protein